MSGAPRRVPYTVQARRIGAALELSPRGRHVLLLLATYANDRGWAWPSVARLACGAGVSRRTVERALAELERAGAVRRVSAPGFTVRYRLALAQELRGPVDNSPWGAS